MDIRNKKIIVILIVIFTLGIIIYNFPISHKINKDIAGVQCRIGDFDYTENVSIRVDGVYKQYLLKKDRFKGTIKFDKYEFSTDDYEQNLEFGVLESLFYKTYDEDNADSIITFGQILFTKDFNDILVLVNEQGNGSSGWSGEDGVFISAKAINRDEALLVAKKIFSKRPLSTYVNWK